MGIAVWFSYAHCIQTNLNLNAKFCFLISLCLQNSKYSCNKVAFSKNVHQVLGLCNFHPFCEKLHYFANWTKALDPVTFSKITKMKLCTFLFHG